MGEKYLPTETTEKVLQVCFALLPEGQFKNLGSKTSTYSSKAKWLKKYGELFENAAKPEPDPEKKRQYECILGIVGEGWKLYEEWKNHKEYSEGYWSSRKNVTQSAVNKERRLKDGMVFPVLAAYSEFVVEKNGNWILDIPPEFSKPGEWQSQLAEAARDSYKDSASSNPQIMGKTATCYSTLSRITKMYKKNAH